MLFTRTAIVSACTCALLALGATTASAQRDDGGAAGVEPLDRVQLLTSSQVTRPVFVTHAPGDYSRIFIVEQRVGSTGRVRIYDLHNDELLSTPFLSVSGLATGNEQGLLGLAFHPNYAENGHFYVNFTTGAGTVVRRYTVSENNPNVADPTSLKTILTFSQPFTNHNAGWIGFGPDGYLYVTSGDGGSGGDPQNNSQNRNNLLGKMLRIDVDTPDDSVAYLIPPDNPFVGASGADEIWSYGLRNPWRSSFDREFGDLFIADVGQNLWEEINFQHADSTGGENYGWRCYEGNATFNPTGCPPASTMVFPFHVYGISGNPRCAVVGGYVYRGCNIPSLNGTYFFADYCPGHILSLEYDRDAPAGSNPVSNFTNHSNTLGANISGISSFGQDARGELYFTALFNGVWKIVPETPTVSHADLNCNGVVDVFDLLELLSTWGECFGCKADFDGNGVVDVFDLLELLSEWG